MKGMPDGPEIREQERRLAQRFFSGSPRFETEGLERGRASRPRGRKSSGGESVLGRRMAEMRVFAPLRVLIVVVLGFALWQGAVWWVDTRPNPRLLKADFRMSSEGCVVEFTVANLGTAGKIKMIPQVIEPDGKIVSGRPVAPEQSRFREGEVKNLRATITAYVRYAPVACTVKFRPVPRVAR